MKTFHQRQLEWINQTTVIYIGDEIWILSLSLDGLLLYILGLINFEMPPPQKRFSLESAQQVRPPLICPDPLKVKRMVAPPCCRPRTRADHLQPAKHVLWVINFNRYRNIPDIGQFGWLWLMFLEVQDKSQHLKWRLEGCEVSFSIT